LIMQVVWRKETHAHKNNIPRDVDTTSRNMKAFIPLAQFTIANEHTLLSPEIQFVSIIGPEIWPASSPKNLDHREISLTPVSL
jgi:hypothetical protein